MRKKADHRFDSVTQKDLADAQKALNDLCQSYGLKPWDIKSGKALWKELCLRMIGLPAHNAKKAGRPGYSEDDIAKIGLAVDLYNDFDDLTKTDENGNIIKAPSLSEEEIHKAVMQEHGIIKKERPSGNFSKPENILKGILYRWKKLNQKYKEEYDPENHPDNF